MNQKTFSLIATMIFLVIGLGHISENHRKHHEYSKAKKREQSEFWNWRHAHPDKERQEFPNLK
jgi:hypothetical protein